MRWHQPNEEGGGETTFQEVAVWDGTGGRNPFSEPPKSSKFGAKRKMTGS